VNLEYDASKTMTAAAAPRAITVSEGLPVGCKRGGRTAFSARKSCSRSSSARLRHTRLSRRTATFHLRFPDLHLALENDQDLPLGCISGSAACANRSRAFFSLSESARSISPCISSAVRVWPLASLNSTLSRIARDATSCYHLILAESLRYPAHRHHIGEHSFRYT
jgi:hypothetical protein